MKLDTYVVYTDKAAVLCRVAVCTGVRRPAAEQQRDNDEMEWLKYDIHYLTLKMTYV